MTVLGALALSFECDDAYITYRYVANAHAGHGLVWNPAPFQPVEGYTSFLWAMLLWAMWSGFGIAPPDAANPLSIAFGVAQFALVAWAALSLRDRDGRRRPWLGVLALAAIATNRTFVQWLTSGLETALFGVAFVGWVLWAFRQDRGRTGWLAVWSTAAAAAALTRPDGLLLVAVTAAVGAFAAWRGQRGRTATALGLAPLVAVLLHVGWRRWFYGEWLPNTYYAKVVAAWPEAGLRYLACFVVEHGTWLVPLVALVWLAGELLRAPGRLVRLPVDRPAATAAVLAVVFHTGYYVFEVGGDHFEYRVLSQLVPLQVLAVAAMAARLSRGPVLPLIATGALWLASGVGWLHFALTQPLPPHGFQPLAPKLPAALAPAARWYDRQQAWLLFHNIGLRCAYHAILFRRFHEPFPGRLHVVDPPDPFPIYAIGAVGLVGWCLPDCAILDHHGLNDWVVARTPVRGFGPPLDREALRPILAAANADGDDWLTEAELRRGLALLSGGDGQGAAADFLVTVMLAIHAKQRPDAMTLAEAEGIGDMLVHARSMAHERHPPDGYVEDFEPNVAVVGGEALTVPRRQPMTAERIRALEQKWRDAVRQQR